MKHLKLFVESLEYDNREISEEEWESSYNELVPFTDEEKEKISRFIGMKGSKSTFKNNYCYSRINKGRGKHTIFFIYAHHDEWFVVEVHDVDPPNNDVIKHYLCDQLGGLFEIMNQYISDVDDKPEFASKQMEKKRRSNLLKEINKKMRIMTVAELEEMKKKM